MAKLDLIYVSNIKTIFSRLYIGEHVQFMATMADKLPDKAKGLEIIEPFVDDLLVLVERQDDIFKKIHPKTMTEDLHESDINRDSLFRACKSLISIAKKTGSAEEKEAARQLSPVFDAYRDITSASYEDETGQIANFVRDMREKASFVDQVTGMKDKLDKLDVENLKFIESFNKRTETVEQQKLLGRMTEIREELDELFVEIAMSINSLYKSNMRGKKDEGIKILLFNAAKLINAYIDRYVLVLAHRGVHIKRGDTVQIPDDGNDSSGGGSTPTRPPLEQ